MFFLIKDKLLKHMANALGLSKGSTKLNILHCSF